ncbi:alpha/beta hydrolase family protein [Variovorax ginsengisoli]|uniref:Alpha/beta hydrolase n=1 Tax=Variovorax ginsengisoli TaxID=363844 RepID=A0ABT8S3K5_9BURK|nr:alpha/beta family hydrolase [Variovorax ginsengisoli]MDN8614334.1 alpha/beta hydrolase [Variovorax ginsengisoli]MDO1533504.1 alpha/beta hydrolase [Variovorax ginsengisoli]
MTTDAQPATLTLDDGQTVSALLQSPPAPRACYVLAHGAGAGMAHAFMAEAADGLVQRGIATLRYQFPYMERGSKRTDPPAIAQAAVRAAVAHAAGRFPSLPLFAGGKSFGGRMTSQAQSLAPLPGVAGLVFLGFPLHPAGAPSNERARHLFDVRVPMLFVQGTRDKLAEFDRIEKLVAELGPTATLLRIAEADHSFHVLVRSGRSDAEVMAEVLDGAAAWMLR